MFITKSQFSLKYFSSYNKEVGFRCGYIQGLSNIARTLPLFLSLAYYLCFSFHIWFFILLQINFLQNHKGRFLEIILYLFTASNTSWREYSPHSETLLLSCERRWDSWPPGFGFFICKTVGFYLIQWFPGALQAL